MNILCFGEPLIRLATQAHERLDEAQTLDVSYGGAEAVVAITLAQLGQTVRFASKLSANKLGGNALMNLARYGVDTSRVMRSHERMGIYYSERGMSIRPTLVTYDRSGTAMAKAHHSDFDWDKLLNGIEVFFFSGVVPAISEEMYLACLESLQACKGRGIKTVMDLNYRETMWESHHIASDRIQSLLPHVDQLIASEDDILAFEGAAISEDALIHYCQTWSHHMYQTYHFDSVCFVARQVDRYDVARIQGGIITDNQPYLSQEQIVSIADISSSGSVFAANIVHGEASRWDAQFIVDYATMASAFKTTIYGDLSTATEAEIISLLTGSAQPHIRQ